jgi:hypothetical protein
MSTIVVHESAPRVRVGPGTATDGCKIGSSAQKGALQKAAREKVEKLVREGKTEAEVVAADPLKELTATWGTANPQAGVNMTKQVYHSFSRS